MNRPHLIPGASHPITIQPAQTRVVVRDGDRVVADSTNALALQESTYPVVYYIPLADVDESLLERTDHSTYCPYKGDASYYSVGSLANSVWTYETPFEAVAPIAKHVAFYADRFAVTVS